jgi:hypothetical protein
MHESNESIRNTVASLRGRAVLLEFEQGKLRCRGPITPGERSLLIENGQIVAAILIPDLTLPDDLFIPADCPNDHASIAACINSQRIRIAA